MQSKKEVNKRLWPHDGILIRGRAQLCAARRIAFELPGNLFLPCSIHPQAQVCFQTSARSLPNGAAHTRQRAGDFGVTLPRQWLP